MGKNVNLAGFNVDRSLLENNVNDDKSIATPETLCAAYARVSRNPSVLGALRYDALKDVAKAQATNEHIIFDYGHASIAEHAYFNFDIFNVSRLAVEALEHTRLASYTEQSQRYQKIDGVLLNIPQEIARLGDSFVENIYYSTISLQQSAYKKLLREIDLFLRKKYGDSYTEAKGTKALEDARYLLPLATPAQLGMSINGRSLECTIGRLRAFPLLEVVDLGNQLYDETKKVAPSLLRYCAPNKVQLQFDLCAMSNINVCGFDKAYDPKEEVTLLNVNDNTPYDKQLLTIIVSTVFSMSHRLAQGAVSNLWHNERENIFKLIYDLLDKHTVPPRQWETIQFNFELLVSASCFAQLKRHRMGTIIPSNYDINLGVTVPSSIEDAGCGEFFVEIIEKTNEAHRKLSNYVGRDVADYILTNAHRRRVHVTMNLRELYNFMRLRLDKHAQWDIRRLANKMKAEIQEVAPLGAMLLCGKDSFK